MDSLAAWVRAQNGFVDETITIRDGDPNDPAKRRRGVFAGPYGLPNKHIFLKLPYTNLISENSSRISQCFDEWNVCYELTSWDSLILALIYEETHRPSPWDAYLDFLPAQIETPLFWSDVERQLLEGTAAEVTLGCRAIEAGFRDRLLPLMRDHHDKFPSGEVELRDLYRRFGALVMAYSFTLGKQWTDESDSDADEPDRSLSIAMVPIADALNHWSFRQNSILVHGDFESCVFMQTTREIPPGGELINTYGELGNDVLLVRYGFIDDSDNPYTNALIRYSDFTSTVGQKAFQRMSALGHNDCDLVNEYFFLRRPNYDEDLLEQMPDCLKTLLICAVVSDDELARIMKSGDIRNPRPHAQQILQLLQQALRLLPCHDVDVNQLKNYQEGSRPYIVCRLKLEAANILSTWRFALDHQLDPHVSNYTDFDLAFSIGRS